MHLLLYHRRERKNQNMFTIIKSAGNQHIHNTFSKLQLKHMAPRTCKDHMYWH